jgi:hypothetical protein
MENGSACDLFLCCCRPRAEPGPDWKVAGFNHALWPDDYGRVTLKADGARWTGEMFGDAFTVTLDGSAIEVRCQERDQKGKHCGVLKGRLSEGVMSASGNLYDQESTWTARRAPTIERSSARHDFVPKVYHNQFSGQIEPALRIRPAKPSMRRPWTLEVWMRTERTSPRAGIL